MKKNHPLQQNFNRISKELGSETTDLNQVSEPEKKLQELLGRKEKARIETLRKKYASKVILGFTVYLCSESKKETRYYYWKAHNLLTGKQIRLGSSLEGAEEKIKAFLEKEKPS